MKLNKAFFVLTGLVLAFGCKDKEKVTPDCNTPPVLSFQQTEASCGQSDGKLSISATGGIAPYEYSIDGNSFQATPDFANLPSSAYTLTVRDKNLCSSSLEAILDETSSIVGSFETTPSGCGSSEGSIIITSSGGDGKHRFSLDGGEFQETNTFSNLNSKEHLLKIKDSLGCSKTISILVKSGIDFAKVVKPIIDGNCAVSGCHVFGGHSPDLTKVSNIKSNAAEVKRKTGNRSMPLKGSLTDDEIQQIACWVNDGADIN